MAQYHCPACAKYGFTWFDDPEVSSDTCWGCRHCDYFATENESLIAECSDCGKEKSAALMVDEVGRFRFCLSCNHKELKLKQRRRIPFGKQAGEVGNDV